MKDSLEEDIDNGIKRKFKKWNFRESIRRIFNRKFDSGYRDVSIEQFLSVASSVLHAIESTDTLIPKTEIELNIHNINKTSDIDVFMNVVTDRLNKYASARNNLDN